MLLGGGEAGEVVAAVRVRGVQMHDRQPQPEGRQVGADQKWAQEHGEDVGELKQKVKFNLQKFNPFYTSKFDNLWAIYQVRGTEWGKENVARILAMSEENST